MTEDFIKVMNDIVERIKQAMINVVEAVETALLAALGWDDQDYAMYKFITNLPTRGWIADGFAYLIVLDNEHPSKSQIIKERLPYTYSDWCVDMQDDVKRNELQSYLSI